MDTIILHEPGRLIRAGTDPPGRPGPGEALVRVHRVGICGTDLHAFQGRQPFFHYPRILGHELGVEVVAVGEGVTGLRLGDRCAVEPYLYCGSCTTCRRGKTNCCTQLRVLGVHVDGGMREVIALPAWTLHTSATLDLDQFALVETLCIGAHAVDRARLEPDEWTLVIGAGPIGLTVVQFARMAGARIILLELNEHRVAFCRQQFDVEHVLDSAGDPVTQLQTLLSGDLPTAVFDATGSARSMTAALQYVANGGRVIFVGITQETVSFQGPEFHRREMTILSSRNALGTDLSRVIRLMEDGTIDTRPWITHRAGVDDIVEQFPSWLDPGQGVVKALLAF
ncbi:MAG: zinc-binding alcohol dehydrogenase family protein [Candidatus Latescibacteria bacterium]|nr:zinc-binding alcohol dehydrogenase family protein [Candidatus Latescibacterota bacterium]